MVSTCWWGEGGEGHFATTGTMERRFEEATRCREKNLPMTKQVENFNLSVQKSSLKDQDFQKRISGNIL